MRVQEEEESPSPYWRSSTNWLVADGSLEGSISFVTSSTEGGDVIPTGVLLERPADSPPCEITIFFRQRHDLHSIYVRSSARVYEVYYASDSKVSSNEYLCTVRCAAALQEAAPDMSERVLAEGINADFPSNNNNNVVEDGWVEVGVPDSLLPDNGEPSMPNISVENFCTKTQVQYEATAEISDASPCMSITLRLLSLQTKTFVHIDEIYIYADPVEDPDPEPPVSGVGAGSFLSMLVPSLLQLSKSGVLAGPKYLSSTEGTIHAACPDKFEVSEVESSSMMGNSKVGLDQQHNEESSKIASYVDPASETKTDENNGFHSCLENLLDEPVVRHAQTKSGDGNRRLTGEEKGSDRSQMALNTEANAPHVLEKILDDLVSRMGKLENFCSSFQESILKPLTGIEMRLQRIEERLDTFSKAPMSSETYSSTRISPRFEDEGCKSSSTAVDCGSHENDASVDLLMVSSRESEKISGLIIKAPEFLDDDDDDESNIGYSVDLTPSEYPKSGKCVSFDSAFASALAAFVASATDISSPNNSHPVDAPNERQNGDNHFLDSPADAVHLETDRNSLPEWFLGDEMYQSEKSCSDIVDPDSTLNKFDIIDRTGEKVQANCFCDESLLAGDDSSAEIEAHEFHGLIITAPEFPDEDDIIDCGENSEPHVSDCHNTHSHALPLSRSTPLALFLSSRKVSPSRSSLNSHDDPLELSTSDRNSFSLTTCEAQVGSVGMRTSSLKNCVNTAVESSLVGWFLSQGGSPRQLDFFHDTAVVENENPSFIRHIMDEANHVSKFDGLHSNETSKGYNITPSDFDDIFMRSEPHPEYSDSEDVDCFIGAFAVTGQNGGKSSVDCGSSETIIRCPSGDGTSQMKPLFEPKQLSNCIPCQDDLTSNVEFCADENLRSWLPLEILLGEKQDDDRKKNDPLEVSNPDDQGENSDFGNEEYNKQHSAPAAQGFGHNGEIADNSLLDIEDSVVQSEISSMVTPGTPRYPVCFSIEHPFSSLI